MFCSSVSSFGNDTSISLANCESFRFSEASTSFHNISLFKNFSGALFDNIISLYKRSLLLL